MKSLIVTISFGLITASAQGMVRQSDGTPQNIQFLHENPAQDGDTITLPAGTFTWSVPLKVSKGVTILGQTTVNSDNGTYQGKSIIVDTGTDANNQNSPGTFLTLGAAISSGSGTTVVSHAGKLSSHIR